MRDVLFKPIVKAGKSDRTDSSNYRAIAYGSIFFKLFELVFLNKFSDKLDTADNQFGFKPKHSTALCCWSVKEVIMYYICKCSYVFACFLDCSKAFDMVNYCVLFRKLKDRGVDGAYLRLLAHTYLNQHGCVQWGNSFSTVFPILNGVRQGGILSPAFFSIYADGFLSAVRSTGCGCFYGTQFVGIFLYADDIVLLCPSLRGLRKMVAAASAFAQSINLNFNPTKSMAVRFGNPVTQQFPLVLNGVNIMWVSEVRYLGVILDCMLNDSAHYHKMLVEFYARCNAVLRTFKRFPPDILLHLFNAYSCCYYGIVCCNLLSKGSSDLHVGWNKAVRRIFGLPYRTHTRFLSTIIRKPDVKSIFRARFVSFAYTTLHSRNRIVKSIACSSWHNQRSILGKNLCYVLQAYGINIRDSANVSPAIVRKIIRCITAVATPGWREGFILDLLNILHTNPPDRELFNTILQYLCCE
jgi:hypothetical protein